MSKELEIMKEERERLVQEDYADSVIEECDLVIKALQRLEAIENSNPSEALECLEKLSNKAFKRDCFTEESLEELKTPIKQALLKAQEPKHYLKWEDLEFTRDEKVMLVKMGDTVYKILYRCCDGIEEVQLLSEDEKLLILNLIGKYKDNIQVFYDLRLERVEE